MMNYPKYVIVNGHKYKINTDFRVALECNRISSDKTIGQYYRALKLIGTLYGEEVIDNKDDHAKLLEYARSYLLCGKEKEIDHEKDFKPDMDYDQDMDYIEASFMSDYHIDLANVEMHWWKFNNLMNGLSNSEFGNCCILNRIRNLRNYDLKDIKDPKERRKIEEAKKAVALKNQSEKPKATEEQLKNAEEFIKALKI